MLALLTPWMNIGQLKHNDQTFQEAFESFLSTADMHTLNIIDNINTTTNVLTVHLEKSKNERKIHLSTFTMQRMKMGMDLTETNHQKVFRICTLISKTSKTHRQNNTHMKRNCSQALHST